MSDRQMNGRFVKGHTLPGPGRPGLRTSTIMRDAYKQALTSELALEIANKIIGMATKGDLDAAKEVADRVGGKTSDSHTVDQVEQLSAEVDELRNAIRQLTDHRAAV